MRPCMKRSLGGGSRREFLLLRLSGNAYNAPPFAREHSRKHRATQSSDACEIQLHRCLPLLFLRHRATTRCNYTSSSRVDQDVDTTQPLCCFGRDKLSRSVLKEVGKHV